ncbi:MAG: exodeoxyribonuclease VII large subunit [Betaproteobacteria bacterium]
MTETYTPGASLAPPRPVIPVSMLNRLAREQLESAFPLCWVSGEVSNLTHAASGHVYFSLKDENAQVRCVMFRNRAQLLGWRLQNGQHLEARVLVTLYEARGDFQLNVETARKAGVGNLYEQFLRLKDQLEREGLLASAGKRALPAYPRRIGIITSLQAAALRDVLSTLTRRAPHLDIILYPTPVQGEDAAALIAAAVLQASQRAECDVLILCRGGGSIEDLWAFNDEALARTIRASTIPVITGIGHETDFTIADFVADQRAPTPTAAAELATAERSVLVARLSEVRKLLRRQIGRGIDQRHLRLDGLALRLQHPAQALTQQRERLLNLQRRLDNSLREASTRGRSSLAQLTQRLIMARPDTGRYARRLDALAPKLHGGWQKCIDARAGTLARIAASLTHLNPDGVLARGYSIVTDSQGIILRSSQSLEPNDRIAVCFHTGRVDAEVTSVSK